MSFCKFERDTYKFFNFAFKFLRTPLFKSRAHFPFDDVHQDHNYDEFFTQSIYFSLLGEYEL